MVAAADVRIARPRHQCANPSNGLPPHSLPAVRRLLTSPQRVLVGRLLFTPLSLPDENRGGVWYPTSTEILCKKKIRGQN